MRGPIISVKNLVKHINGRIILNGISFDVYPGEMVVIMGSSGCGKSTLLKHLVGLYSPDKGSIKLFGIETVGLKDEKKWEEIRKRFGILFQTGALYNSMSVGENIALPLREHTNLDEHIIKIMVKMKLELVGLRDFENLMPAQLSGGMKKRVALARAIALDPEILFYDEPSAGLDPIMTAVIDKLMLDLNKKMHITSVVVTHDMKSAFRIADRILMMYQGKIIADDTPENIKKSNDPYLKQFINGNPDGPIPLYISKKDFLEEILEV